jgi:hypothetical protein
MLEERDGVKKQEPTADDGEKQQESSAAEADAESHEANSTVSH